MSHNLINSTIPLTEQQYQAIFASLVITLPTPTPVDQLINSTTPLTDQQYQEIGDSLVITLAPLTPPD